MTKIEQTIEQMVEALENIKPQNMNRDVYPAIKAGRALLEELKGQVAKQASQEPVAAVHVVRQYDQLASYYVEMLNRDTPTGVYYAYNTTPQPAQQKE